MNELYLHKAVMSKNKPMSHLFVPVMEGKWFKYILGWRIIADWIWNPAVFFMKILVKLYHGPISSSWTEGGQWYYVLDPWKLIFIDKIQNSVSFKIYPIPQYIYSLVNKHRSFYGNLKGKWHWVDVGLSQSPCSGIHSLPLSLKIWFVN